MTTKAQQPDQLEQEAPKQRPAMNPETIISELKDLLYSNDNFSINFPQDYEQKIRDNFRLFDRNKDGYLTLGEVQTLLVSIDVEIHSQDVKIIYEKLQEEGKGVTEDDFFLFVMKKIKDENKEAELIQFFKVIDKEGKGVIEDLELFKDMLMCKGLRMTEEDADALLEAMGSKGGEDPIDYSEFCKLITAKDDGKKKKKKGGKKEGKKKK